MRILASLTAVGFLAVIVCPDEANARSPSRGVASQMRANPAARRGRAEPSGAPLGASGIIRWNTPNASGNLGGPSAGGGGGNGA